MRQLMQFISVITLVMLLGAASFAQAPVQLTLWHHWGGEREALVDKMIADFEGQYPWITVESIYSATGGAADRMGTLLLSGVAPEVMMVRGVYAFQFMSHGGFLPLDELIARDNIDLSAFNPGDLRGFQLHERTYALPFMSGSAWTNLMFYNKDMMDNAGLDSDKPASTWSEWRSQALWMMKRDDGDRVTQGGTHIPSFTQIASWNNSSLWSDDWRRATVGDSEAHEAVQFMRDLVAETYGTWSNFNAFYRYGESFWEGLSGTYFTNNSGFALANDPAIGFRWGAALAPVNERNPAAQPINMGDSTWAYGIPNDIAPDKKEAAWLLLQWLTVNEEGAGYFARAQGRPSPVIEFNRHPDYGHINPYWDVVLASLAYDKASPPVNALNTIATVGPAVIGGTHPDQAFETANRTLQAALDDYWRTVGQ